MTRYQRNKLGQVEIITDALGHTEHYTYDARGQLIEKLDKEGYLTKYGYTAQGDVNHITYADGKEVRLSYNPLRQLEEMEDWLGITRIENDAMGRAARVRYPDGREVSYTYGKSGQRTSITYPDGREINYLYDSQLRLSGLKDGDDTIVYSYDEKGRLARKAFPNGMETSYAYNAEGYLAELTHRDREGVLDRYAYQYDLTGNKTVIEKQRRGLAGESGSYTYGYDALGRLSTVTRNGENLRTYGYDAFGNRNLMREGGTETSYTYNAMNQLVSRTDTMNEETYIYDRRGNLSFIMENGALKNQYTYGALNRLEQAVNGQGEAASYIYNGLGYRVGKTTGATVGNIGGIGTLQGTDALDPMDRLKEQTIRPETKIQYTIDLTRSYHNLLQKEEGGGTQIYLWDGNVAGMAEGDKACSLYYCQDDLGSPIRLMDNDGNVEESYGYDEFGQDLYGNQGMIQPFGYTGYQADQIAGTYFAQAREYMPGMGRFGGEDPIKKGLNWYIYCQNNSLRFFDPLGLEKIVISGGVYSEEKKDNDGYYYEFVDAAIAQIQEWKELNNDDNITWIIADNGWTTLNKSELEKAAKHLGVNVQFVTSKNEIFTYINDKNGDGDERLEDKITDISVFSHGLLKDGGTISLGYNYNIQYNTNLNINAEDISEIKEESFAKNVNSSFYSCNIGTDGDDSFAQKWENKFGGTTIAFKGRTDYAKVPDNSMKVRVTRKLAQIMLKVSVFGGNPSLPIAGEGAEQIMFLSDDFRNNCID